MEINNKQEQKISIPESNWCQLDSQPVINCLETLLDFSFHFAVIAGIMMVHSLLKNKPS